MSDISQLLDSALTEEPGTAPDVEAILAAARRRQRRRRLASAGSGLALTAGLAGVAVAVTATGGSSPAPAGDGTGPATSVSAATSTSAVPSASASTPVSPSATGRGASGGTDVHGITRHNLAALVEQKAGVRLSGVQVQDLPPTGDINLAAGIASAQGQYLNVQVSPAGTSTTTVPTCADLSGSAPDGDGYTGPCTVTPTAGGGYFVVRSGRTPDARFAITQAEIVGRNGSSIMAEATNQSKQVGKRLAPAVTHDPPLTTAQLRQLVLALNSYR